MTMNIILMLEKSWLKSTPLLYPITQPIAHKLILTHAYIHRPVLG